MSVAEVSPRRTLVWLTVYAVAMANVEAVVVVYLRDVYYPDDPAAIFPLVFLSPRDVAIEMAREMATLAMILAVAALVARRLPEGFAAFLYVFGVWDIFYYAWLKLLLGWPVTWLGWDVLFLIPWPWLGPWVSAALVALAFVAWGGWAIGRGVHLRFSPGSLALFVAGAVLIVACFLSPAAPLLAEGGRGLEGFEPASFSWGIYVAGYLLIVAGLWRLPRRSPAP